MVLSEVNVCSGCQVCLAFVDTDLDAAMLRVEIKEVYMEKDMNRKLEVLKVLNKDQEI